MILTKCRHFLLSDKIQNCLIFKVFGLIFKVFERKIRIKFVMIIAGFAKMIEVNIAR